MAEPRTVLIVSGLDPSGGAGFIADVRLAEVLGCRAVGAITALTEQDTAGVRAVHPVGAGDLSAALTTLLTDVEVHAVKIGMLGSVDLAEAIGDALALTAAPVVWDPVFLPSRGGAALLVGDPARAIAALTPHVTVVTPNRDEAFVLSSVTVTDADTAAQAGTVLRSRGLAAVLVKGGHLDGPPDDVLVTASATTRLPGSRIVVPPGGVHGTGCALSTAIACRLALGDDLATACRAAKQVVATRLAAPVSAGRGRASVL